MLAPEIWAFDPPSSLLKVKEVTQEESESPLKFQIENHHFNHLVSVILPDTAHIPEEIYDSLKSDSDYYKVKNISVHELIQSEFVDSFIKKGKLSLLSIDTHIDLDNCIALTGNGHLVLSLLRDSYQALGLEGRPVVSKSKEPQRYVVTVDLTAEHFRPGKKNYERASAALRDRLHNFDVILAWGPQDEEVCPSSVASYLSGKGIDIEVCKPHFEQRRDYNVKVPKISPAHEACEVEELVEWLGLFSLNTESCNGTQNEFLSSYKLPEELEDCGQVAVLTWTGFFTPTQISHLMAELRAYQEGRERLPWISLYVQGFADSPINWHMWQHSFHTDGDNSYTIIMKPDKKYIIVSLQSNNRMVK